MSSIKISEEEKKGLRNDAKEELLRLEQIFSCRETVELLDSFKNKYNVCESAYKVVLAEHQKRKNKPKTGRLQVSMREAPHALSFAGYSFDRNLLSNLFGGDKSTVKELRNAVTHSVDEKAVAEIARRKEELFGYMDSFISTIKNFDAA